MRHCHGNSKKKHTLNNNNNAPRLGKCEFLHVRILIENTSPLSRMFYKGESVATRFFGPFIFTFPMEQIDRTDSQLTTFKRLQSYMNVNFIHKFKQL